MTVSLIFMHWPIPGSASNRHQDSIQVPDVGGYHKPRPRTSSKSPQPVDFPNLKRRLLSTFPSLAGRKGAGKDSESDAVSIIPRGSCSGGGLAGRTAAAAGSGWTCWRSQECSAPSPTRVLCCRLCQCAWPSQKKKKKWHGKKWPGTLSFPQCRLARRERSICCCSGTPLLLDCCWKYVRAGLNLYTFGLRMCADSTTPFYLLVSGPRLPGLPRLAGPLA